MTPPLREALARAAEEAAEMVEEMLEAGRDGKVYVEIHVKRGQRTVVVPRSEAKGRAVEVEV